MYRIQEATNWSGKLDADPLDAFRVCFKKAEASDWLSRRNGKKEIATTFDWLMEPRNFWDTVEGKYDNPPKRRGPL